MHDMKLEQLEISWKEVSYTLAVKYLTAERLIGPIRIKYSIEPCHNQLANFPHLTRFQKQKPSPHFERICNM